MRRIQTLFSIALTVLPLAISASASAQAKAFKVETKSAVQSTVPDATGDFVLRGDGINGELSVDPAKADKTSGELKIPVSSFKTGNATRDGHLVSDTWFNAAKFPNAILKITSVSGAKVLKPNEAVPVTVKGKLTLHGVTKEVSVDAKVRYTPGSPATLHIVGSFKLNWRDYGVPTSTIAGLAAKKMDDVITLNVDLYASAAK